MDLNVKLSLCMIVKNEEDVIRHCLDSVADCVDEIIVVDTGSTDNTKEICRGFTDKVFDFEWSDDFAAARNYSFSLASCEYILWLDADDVVSAQDALRLKQLKSSLAKEAADVVMCRYDTDFDEDGQPIFSFFRERIVKRSAGFLWEGFIHECITPKGKIFYSDFSVQHRKIHSSGDRNLRIFQKKIAQGFQLDARNTFYYGRELFYNNMFAESAAVLENALEIGVGMNTTEACLFLADCYMALGKSDKAFLSLCRSFENKEPRADVVCKIAEWAKQRKDWSAAAFWYKAALACSPTVRSGEFDRAEYRQIVPLIELSCCYFNLGQYDQALEYHHKAKAIRPRHPSVLFNEKIFTNFEKTYKKQLTPQK